MQKFIPTCAKEAIERNKFKINREENNAPNENNSNMPNENNVNMPNENGSNMPNENNANMPTSPTVPSESTAGYPEIVDAEPSMFEVKLLKWLASSRNGEITAVNNYLYQYFILQESYPTIANALREISIDEMEHFERLSEAIVLFGGNPNLTDGRGNVWTGRNVSQLKNVKDILNFDLKSEKAAVLEYQNFAQRTRNESLAKLFLRIAEDEKEHIVILENLIKSLN